MSHNDILSAVDRMVAAGAKLEIAEGKVQSVSGANANVLISGTTRQQQAWYFKNISLSPGDDCLMIRSPQGSRWIILGAFSTNIGGSSETLLNSTGGTALNSAAAGAYRNRGMTGIFAGNEISLANQNNTYLNTLVFRPSKAVSSLLVGFSGYLKGTTAGLYGGVRILVNGTVIAESVGSLSSSVAANARENLATTGLRLQVPVSDYTIQLQAITSSVSGADNIIIVSPQFYVIEI